MKMKQLTRRLIVLLAALALPAAFVAGCDDSARESAPAPQAQAPAETGNAGDAGQPVPQPQAEVDDARDIPAIPSTRPADEPPIEQPPTPPLAEAADTGALNPFTQIIPGSLVEFEMIPVPGGEGIAAFYMGKHEVTWDEFAYWAFVNDQEREIQKIQLRAKKLRPSPPYDQIDRGFGLKDRPALGMSRHSAELYCQWLSEQTGRTYRLPTKEEWQHAFRLGYGSLTPQMTPEELAEVAWFADNAGGSTRTPASLRPSDIGLYDMLGNVAEWVTDTGEQRIAVGGHFKSPAELLTGEAMEVEDESWNLNYPNEPKSIWWFVDADFVGFRVVCEPEPGDAPAPQGQ